MTGSIRGGSCSGRTSTAFGGRPLGEGCGIMEVYSASKEYIHEQRTVTNCEAVFCVIMEIQLRSLQWRDERLKYRPSVK